MMMMMMMMMMMTVMISLLRDLGAQHVQKRKEKLGTHGLLP
jgi:hypothetical protein